VTTALALYGAVCSTLAVFLVLRSARPNDAEHGFGPPDTGPPLGALMTSRAAVDVLGRPIVVAEGDEQVLAFFSTTCHGCLSRLPRFIAGLEASGLSGDADVAVLVGPPAAAEKTLTEALTGVVQLVREKDRAPIANAFNVQLFPSFVKLEKGVVVAKGLSAADVLPAGRAADLGTNQS